MSDEIDEIVALETIEDAVARIRDRLPPGHCVLLHAEDCEIEDDDGCTCTPILVERTEEQA